VRFTAHHTIEIAAPAEELFDYIADSRHEREWNPVCHEMEQITRGLLGVGTRFRGCFQFVGQMDFEIVAYDRPRLLVHRAWPWLAEVQHDWLFTQAGGATRLDQRGVMTPRARGWLLAPLMPLIVRKNLSDTANALKRTLER
jgi:uncharacterized protein YndB with AHSA1/START domain